MPIKDVCPSRMYAHQGCMPIKDATPTRAVHKSNGDKAVCVQLNRCCVFLFCIGDIMYGHVNFVYVYFEEGRFKCSELDQGATTVSGKCFFCGVYFLFCNGSWVFGDVCCVLLPMCSVCDVCCAFCLICDACSLKFVNDASDNVARLPYTWFTKKINFKIP